LRGLDQQRLRDQHLNNLKVLRDKEGTKKHTNGVIQEYYWRLRDMEIEKNCRTTEHDWHQLQKQRQEVIARKQKDFAGKSDEDLNLRYGRIFATDYAKPVQRKEPAPADSRPDSEMAMDTMWEAEALGVFRAAFHEAYAQFSTPEPEPPEQDMALYDPEHDLGGPVSQMFEMSEEFVDADLADFATDVDQSRSKGPMQGAAAVAFLKMTTLPKGRVEWVSPRNPWAARRGPGTSHPPVEAVVASLLSGSSEFPIPVAAPEPSRKSTVKRRPQSQALSRYRQLPPVVPQRAILDK